MAKNIKVMFDIDGVLADFCLGFTDRAFLKYGTPVEKTVDHKVWDWFPGMDKKMIDTMWRELESNDKGFWEGLAPLTTPVEAAYIKHLCQKAGVEVYFVTNRHTRTALEQTREWLFRELGVVDSN